MADPLTYLPEVGFRRPGMRLERPLEVERDGRTLTVRTFVCTPDGTDLTYDITDGTQGFTCVVPGSGPNILDPMEKLVIRDGMNEYVGALPFSSQVIAGGVRRVLQARALPPGLRHVELHLAGAVTGEWSVDVELAAFGRDSETQLRPVHGSATHEGITVHVRGMCATPNATAIQLEVVGDGRVQRIAGVGGLHGMRRGPTALVLRDEHGRTYAELPQERRSHPVAEPEVGVFEPLANGVRKLELEVPFVFVDEASDAIAIQLPVTEPVQVTLGAHPIHVTSSGDAPDSPRRRNFGPALVIGLDLGDWHGYRRVLHPSRALVDGQDRGLGYGNGINSTAPEPVTLIEVRMPDPLAARVLTLSGATVQVRGPWSVAFDRG